MNLTRTLDYDWFPQPLPANLVIGAQSWLHSAYACLHYRSKKPCGLRVGHDTGIYVETFFDLGPDGEVSIGNFSTLAGPIISTNGRVAIGDYVLISREVVIADSYVAYPYQGKSDVGTGMGITIEDDVWIGTRAIILGGSHLGVGCIVGAGAVVDFEVPAWAVVAGNPSRIVGWARPPDDAPEREEER